MESVMEQQVKEKVDEIGEKVTSILALLRGNDLDKNDQGIIGTVDDIDKRLRSLEDWKKGSIRYLKGIAIGIAIPSSIGIVKLLEILMDIIKNISK
jgi:paraquat-inducible protein B